MFPYIFILNFLGIKRRHGFSLTYKREHLNVVSDDVTQIVTISDINSTSVQFLAFLSKNEENRKKEMFWYLGPNRKTSCLALSGQKGRKSSQLRS